MKIVFISNFINHHQLPFSHEICKLIGRENYRFVACTPIDAERVTFGYVDENKQHDFVICAYESEAEKCRALDCIMEADVVLWGSASYDMLKERLQSGRLTIKVSERILRTLRQRIAVMRPKNYLSRQREMGRYFNKNLFLLCNGAFVSKDYRDLYRVHQESAFKWGYFTEVISYDVEELLARKKQGGKLSILWAGRFLRLKHPEAAVIVAERLRRDKIDFEINMIGNGEMENQIRTMIAERNLSDCVHMMGSMKPKQVRGYMEQANIFLFTSDRYEGWGAVLNEGMNSGCVVLASHLIGAAPYLIQNGKNGIIFETCNWDHLYAEVKRLALKPELCEAMGREAYRSMIEMWSPENAAQAMVHLCAGLLCGKRIMPKEGPCSQAVFMSERDAKRLLKKE